MNNSFRCFFIPHKLFKICYASENVTCVSFSTGWDNKWRWSQGDQNGCRKLFGGKENKFPGKSITFCPIRRGMLKLNYCKLPVCCYCIHRMYCLHGFGRKSITVLEVFSWKNLFLSFSEWNYVFTLWTFLLLQQVRREDSSRVSHVPYKHRA